MVIESYGKPVFVCDVGYGTTDEYEKLQFMKSAYEYLLNENTNIFGLILADYDEDEDHTYEFSDNKEQFDSLKFTINNMTN